MSLARKARRHWLLLVAVAALVVAAVVAYSGSAEAGGFYWSGWRNWNGEWCTGLFNSQGQIQWFYYR